MNIDLKRHGNCANLVYNYGLCRFSVMGDCERFSTRRTRIPGSCLVELLPTGQLSKQMTPNKGAHGSVQCHNLYEKDGSLEFSFNTELDWITHEVGGNIGSATCATTMEIRHGHAKS